MKFSRMSKFAYEVTPRKIAAIAVRKRHEREKTPLFADEIAAAQSLEPTPEEEMERRLASFAIEEKRLRNRRAEQWIRARRVLRSLSKEDRAAVLERYHGRWMPGNPEVLLDLIHSQMREVAGPQIVCTACGDGNDLRVSTLGCFLCASCRRALEGLVA
jgi:hypothetical protein